MIDVNKCGASSCCQLKLKNKLIFTLCFAAMLCIVCWSSLTYAKSITKSDGRPILQVTIIFRHGDRNPVMSYPNDPHYNYTWPGGLGHLTETGLIQLYTLGNWIRDKYNAIIEKKFDSSEMLVKSSDGDRAIVSAQALLAALFRPEPNDFFVKDLPWRPVPVHTIPRNIDNLLWMLPDCPRLIADRQAYEDELLKADEKNINSLFAKLSNYTGATINTFYGVAKLYDTLLIQHSKNLTLPEWAEKFDKVAMRNYYENFVDFGSSTLTQKRLRGGPLLKEIMDNMSAVLDGRNKKKLYLYSGHDLTVMTLLRTIGIKGFIEVDYGAAVIFELIATDDVQQHDFDVIVKYLNNTQMKEANTLEIPGCNASVCKLSQLYDLWEDVLPTDWNAECQLK